jgi:hypothetical protein
MKSLDNCKDQNGDEFPNPARLANTDYFSTGHGKYNLDKPIFAKLASNKWALHDFRTEFKGNTQDAPLEDGGGGAMKAAARVGANDDNNLVVRCSNVQRNIFNEKSCKISYHPDACSSVPLPDPDNFYRSVMKDPGEKIDHMWKYLRPYAGPDHGGVVSKFNLELKGGNGWSLNIISHILVFVQYQFVDPKTKYPPFPQKMTTLT